MYSDGSWPSSRRTSYLPVFVRSTNTSGVTLGAVVSVKSAPGFGLSLRSSCHTSWIVLDREAGLLGDLRQAIVLEIFQVIRDQRLQLFVERHARR